MTTHRLRPVLLAVAISLLPCAASRAQFVTDSSDVAATDSFDSIRQLQVMFGGSAALSERLSVNVGLVGGRFSASPRAGGVIGFECDF